MVEFHGLYRQIGQIPDTGCRQTNNSFYQCHKGKLLASAYQHRKKGVGEGEISHAIITF